MEPKIIQKEAMIIAGVAGSGDETAKAWEAFMKISKMHPLPNRAEDGTEGYEVRLYPNEGTGKVHVGQRVKTADAPAEYKVFFLPAATYAEFEIYPSKGYESSNAEMDRWLDENSTSYQQAQLDVMKYVIEVYDKRYKGDKDPESVVGILLPVMKVVPGAATTQTAAGLLGEIAKNITQFAGPDTSEKVMKGSNEIFNAKDPVKGALWMKEALERLDEFTDKETRRKIMSACGQSCNIFNHRETEETRQLRMLCATEEDFLAIFDPPVTGARFERDGNTFIQYYTPRKYGKGFRCYCSLVNALPEGINASPTYCQCSRAYVQAHWEEVLGRPVKVELGPTGLTGSDECKFIIHL